MRLKYEPASEPLHIFVHPTTTAGFFVLGLKKVCDIKELYQLMRK